MMHKEHNMRPVVAAMTALVGTGVVWQSERCCAQPVGVVLGWHESHPAAATPIHPTTMRTEKFYAVSAGNNFSLGLRTDGTIRAWGYGLGLVTPPSGTFTQVYAGWSHAVALKDDGTLVVWGDEAANSEFMHLCRPILPKDRYYVKVSAGEYYTLALRDDGVLVGWGLGTGTSSGGHCQYCIPNRQKAKSECTEGWVWESVDSDWAEGLTGGHHSWGRRSAGGLSNGGWLSWGAQQLSCGQTTYPTGQSLRAIVSGHWHTVFVKTNDQLIAHGPSASCASPANQGQTGVDSRLYWSVAPGYFSTVALSRDTAGGGPQPGYLQEWGNLSTPPSPASGDASRFWALGEGNSATHGLALYSSCYADCNGDCQVTVADLSCFQTAFGLGSPFADCNYDGSLTLDDFHCYQNKVGAGCKPVWLGCE